MDLAFKVSVVMTAFNSEKFIASAIESVINQSLDFKRNIQLIVIDDASFDNTIGIVDFYRQKFPENILIIQNDENMGPAYSRNRGLEMVEGEFVNFLDSDDFISEYSFQKAINLFKKHPEIDIASMPIYYFGARRGPHTLNYKYTSTRVVNLLEEPENIQLSGASSFFRFSRLKDYKFKETLRVSEDPLLINQMLLDNPKIGFLSDCEYYYRKHDDLNSLISASTNQKSYFTTRVDDYFMALIDLAIEKCGEVPRFIQHTLMYDLQWIFEIRHITHLLNRQEFKELYAKLLNMLSYIDTDVIMFQKSIEGSLKVHILLLKKYGIEYLSDKSSITGKCRHIHKLGLDRVHIDICQVQKGMLYILGYVTTFKFKPNITIKINSEEIEVNPLSFPQRDNFSLNFSYGFNHHFDVEIPLADGLDISFKTDEFPLIPEYGHSSRLSETSGYILSKDYLVIDGGKQINVKKRSFSAALKCELKTLTGILKGRSEGWRTGIILRILYFIVYPVFESKHIWIFMDLPYMADDNSFQLFRYAVEQNDKEIEKYFAIEKGDYGINDVEIMANKYRSSSKAFKIRSLLGMGNPSGEYLKVADIGFELSYRSIKHRLYSLYAEAIISSNPDNNIIYPFWGNFPHVAGLVKSKTIFLQHGVTKDDVSGWLNKYDKNIDMIATVSDLERQSFIDNDYGYGEDAIRVLGFPRFDRLERLEDAHEIVVMPTWRRHYNNLKDDEFKRTSFFRRFNELLNDEELLDFLESWDYSLIFKPHPNLLKFIHLFDMDERVYFADESYSEIFNHSSLLVTDYSSVFFDFAYLEKPVIYFHYGKDYHFNVDEGYFKYDTMGFGPIANTTEELKNDIIAMVLNDCEMDDIYRKRVEEFFKFRDRDNSKRVYDAVKDMDFE